MNADLKRLYAYCEAHSTPPGAVLHELERETHLKTLAPQMLSGAWQGLFLKMLSQLMRPQTILEIGTFTGYAAICMAQGLAPGGQLHTIEPNTELAHIIRKYIDKAGLNDMIQLHIGRGEEVIPTLQIAFDLVFIDAGKQQYEQFYELIIERVRPGGLILADNVLWSGKVADTADDPDTLTLRAFNDMVQADPRVENVMLPLRDGVLMIRKKA
ncbi:MAG TPA: O-methyltransferase [Saprospiraceae bacterium]|nr:O-methyltransferase [Saprospiraceae bacterium]